MDLTEMWYELNCFWVGFYGNERSVSLKTSTHDICLGINFSRQTMRWLASQLFTIANGEFGTILTFLVIN
jgi:hypothetical protein